MKGKKQGSFCTHIVETEKQSSFGGQFRENVGWIRAVWQDHKGNLKQKSYGTGLAVSKRCILTCSHIFVDQYRSKKQQQCKFIEFTLKIKNKEIVYHTMPQNFAYFEPLKDELTYDQIHPLNQIAIIVLQHSMDLNNFPSIGVSSTQMIDFNLNIEMSGFPYDLFSKKNSSDFYEIVQRVTHKGSVKEIQGNVIHYNIQTLNGQSGASILGYDSQNMPVVLGIHTHIDENSNQGQGVFLDEKGTAILKKFLRKINKEHQLDEFIRFTSTKCQKYINQSSQFFSQFNLNKSLEFQENNLEFYQTLSAIQLAHHINHNFTMNNMYQNQKASFDENFTFINEKQQVQSSATTKLENRKKGLQFQA